MIYLFFALSMSCDAMLPWVVLMPEWIVFDGVIRVCLIIDAQTLAMHTTKMSVLHHSAMTSAFTLSIGNNIRAKMQNTQNLGENKLSHCKAMLGLDFQCCEWCAKLTLLCCFDWNAPLFGFQTFENAWQLHVANTILKFQCF